MFAGRCRGRHRQPGCARSWPGRGWRAAAARPARVSSRPAGSDRDAAGYPPPVAGGAHRRRQEPYLPAPGGAAARHHDRDLAADRPDARPGGGAAGARRGGHLPGRHPAPGRGAAASTCPGRRRVQAGLRRAGAAGERLAARRACPSGVPAGGGRRGALHQCLGPRLPPRLPAARRTGAPAARSPRPGLHRHRHADCARRDFGTARPCRRHSAAHPRLRAAQPCAARRRGNGQAGARPVWWTAC